MTDFDDDLDDDDYEDWWDDDEEDDDDDLWNDDDDDEEEDKSPSTEQKMHDTPDTTIAEPTNHAREVAKYVKQVDKEIAKGEILFGIKTGVQFIPNKNIAKRIKVIEIATGDVMEDDGWHEYVPMPKVRFTHYGIKDSDNEMVFFTPAELKRAKRIRFFSMETELRDEYGEKLSLSSTGILTAGCQTHTLQQWKAKYVGFYFRHDPAKLEAALHVIDVLETKILPKLQRKSSTKRKKSAHRR